MRRGRPAARLVRRARVLAVHRLGVGCAHTSVSPRIDADVSALSGAKHFQRMRAVSLFVNGSMFVGHMPGSAMRLRVDGMSCHAEIIACSVPASSVYGFGFGVQLEHVELRRQLGAAAHRRRRREQRVVAIRAHDRLALRRVVARQIAELHRIALRMEIGDHLPARSRPCRARRRRPSRSASSVQARSGFFIVSPTLSGWSSRKNSARAAFGLEELLALGGERRRESFAHHVAVARGADGRLKQIRTT